jgi:hypothetical protein
MRPRPLRLGSGAVLTSISGLKSPLLRACRALSKLAHYPYCLKGISFLIVSSTVVERPTNSRASAATIHLASMNGDQQTATHSAGLLMASREAVVIGGFEEPAEALLASGSQNMRSPATSPAVEFVISPSCLRWTHSVQSQDELRFARDGPRFLNSRSTSHSVQLLVSKGDTPTSSSSQFSIAVVSTAKFGAKAAAPPVTFQLVDSPISRMAAGSWS